MDKGKGEQGKEKKPELPDYMGAKGGPYTLPKREATIEVALEGEGKYIFRLRRPNFGPRNEFLERWGMFSTDTTAPDFTSSGPLLRKFMRDVARTVCIQALWEAGDKGTALDLAEKPDGTPQFDDTMDASAFEILVEEAQARLGLTRKDRYFRPPGSPEGGQASSDGDGQRVPRAEEDAGRAGG